MKIVFATLLLALQTRGQVPLNARTAAPFDITGYWLATGATASDDIDDVPLNATGQKIAAAWNPAKDVATSQQCRAYGAGGVMRLPGRLHIAWETTDTLRIDAEAGTQTRRFFFSGAQPFPAQASWQGHSIARWTSTQLTATTTHLASGYLRKNGIPYSASTVLNETFARFVDKNGREYLDLSITVDDPPYLRQLYTKSYRYMKQADAAGWNPTRCSAK